VLFRSGARLLMKRAMFNVSARGAHVVSGGDSLMTSVGLYPSLMNMGNDQGTVQWATTATVESRDYTDLNDRDGVYVSAGETLKRFFGPQRHCVSLGLSVAHDGTDQPEYEYWSLTWNLAAEINLPLESTAYVRLRYVSADYEEKEAIFDAVRKDTQHQLTLGLNKVLIGGLGMDINYAQTVNDSTVGLYQYDRNVVTLSAFYAF
jgi:hypothetical protein